MSRLSLIPFSATPLPHSFDFFSELMMLYEVGPESPSSSAENLCLDAAEAGREPETRLEVGIEATLEAGCREEVTLGVEDPGG